MTYRINGRIVTRDEFMANAKGIDFSTPPMIVRDYESYNCPVTGRLIEGKAAHRENLTKHGCRVLEPGETADFIKKRERNVKESTDKMVDKMCDYAASLF